MHSTVNHSDYADVETSSDRYASRFAGSIGEWFIQKQSKILIKFLSGLEIKTVLDVGGGHGQTVKALALSDIDVTVLGSSPECNLQIQSLLNSGKCKFAVGDVEKLPFPDNSFDTVTCLRYLSHTENWQLVISELCRVAKKAVIVDFPPARSFNIMFPIMYNLKRKLEGNTRPFLVFKNSAIREEFKKNSFALNDSCAQFFFPMVVHRVFKSPRISRAIEFLPKISGLTYLFGSPVIECFTIML